MLLRKRYQGRRGVEGRGERGNEEEQESRRDADTTVGDVGLFDGDVLAEEDQVLLPHEVGMEDQSSGEPAEDATAAEEAPA